MPPATAAPLTRPLPQTKAMPLATEVAPVPLTDSECTNLGGAVRSTMAKECSSGKVCRRADAEGVRALLWRHMAREGRQDDAEGAGRDAKPDKHATAEMQPEGRGVEGHADETGGIQKA